MKVLKDPALLLLWGGLLIILFAFQADAHEAPGAHMHLEADLPENLPIPESSPLLRGPHSGGDMQNHWYPGSCCNMNDCAPLRINVDIDKEVYWWWSWRALHQLEKPMYFRVEVPIDADFIQPSQDGNFHGCERMLYDQVDGVPKLTGVEARCFFVPPSI